MVTTSRATWKHVHIDECYPLWYCGHTFQNQISCLVSSRCFCLPGWTGVDCAEDVRECDSGPCLNGAQCQESDTPGEFSCACPPFFTGHLCDQSYDPCDPLHNPCLHGSTCLTRSNGTASCRCSAGEWENCPNLILMLLSFRDALYCFHIIFFPFRYCSRSKEKDAVLSLSTKLMCVSYCKLWSNRHSFKQRQLLVTCATLCRDVLLTLQSKRQWLISETGLCASKCGFQQLFSVFPGFNIPFELHPYCLCTKIILQLRFHAKLFYFVLTKATVKSFFLGLHKMHRNIVV